MSEAHAEKIVNPWGGGKSPFGISYGKLMMWLFLLGDTLTFTALLLSYAFSRFKYIDIWALPNKVYVHFPFIEGHIELAFVALMTFILIMSSVTMVLAVEAGSRRDKAGVVKWLFWTIIGGLFFLCSQAYEWYHFIHGTAEGVTRNIIVDGESKNIIVRGANLMVNEYSKSPLFADFFFFITGFHGTHVLSGVVLNVIVFINTINDKYVKVGHYEMVEKVGLYWHFVDLVWVFVFTFFYLL